MLEFTSMPRRNFLQGTSTMLAASVAGSLSLTSSPLEGANKEPKDVKLTGHIFKTLKIGMVGAKGTLTEKFQAAKEAGFAGIEMNAPGMNVEETKKAIASASFPVDGTVCSSHWQIRHTSPKTEEREKALQTLIQAIRDTRAVGGHTVLLVVGHGKDGEEAEIWKRAQENIGKAVPVAAKEGVAIAIENVWNHFLYDHSGDANQTADKFVKFVDELNSPWVGMQFDIGNHWKYGSMGDWIRALGKRVIKLDLKGFSRAKNNFTKIGEGDLDWKDVRLALKEINYTGWAAAEVGGGNLERLKEISANMDKVFGLA